MGTQAGVGISHHRNPKVAGNEAAEQALAAAGIAIPDFVFMFASVGYKQADLLAAVREATARAPLSGCSGAGVIVHGEADESSFSVGVMAIRSDELHIHHGIATGLKADPDGVGQQIAAAVRPVLAEDAQALFLFPDGLTCNFDRLVPSLERALEPERALPIMGGLAGENWTMGRTYQYCDDTILSDGVAWAVLAGDVELFSVLSHGCVPIGARRTITRSEGNTIYEIDNQPVLQVLEEYLTVEEIEHWLKASTNLSLGFKAPSYFEEQDEYIVRFMPTRDVEAGSVNIYTEVPTGTDVWMTRRDYDKVATSVDRMGDQILARLDGRTPKLVFHFDCAGRGKVMFRDEQKLRLVTRLQERVPAGVPWLGLYTYGELGPVGHHNCFHNYTAVLAVVC